MLVCHRPEAIGRKRARRQSFRRQPPLTKLPGRARTRLTASDVLYSRKQRQLENDFIGAPGVDPKMINLAFVGAKKISTNAAGNLVLETASGTVQLQKPVAYQEVDGSRHEIAVRYNLLDA